MARSLVTPEGVDLGVELADAGARAAALMIDAVIMLLFGVLMTIVAVFGLFGIGTIGLQPLFIAWLLGFFALRNLYFILFEGGHRAATPGKRWLHLRVVSRDGTALSIDQVIARNLMREIELFLPLSMLAARQDMGTADAATAAFGLIWAALFLFFPLFNRDRMRIGDLLAGTWVVRAPRHRLALDLAQEAGTDAEAFRFTTVQLDAYGIAELQKLEEVLRGDNDGALWTVAEAIRQKIGWKPMLQDARPFLTAYYGALRAHLERKLLLGHRRQDKYSR